MPSWPAYISRRRAKGTGLALSPPSIDHLFDRGFIGFEDSGRLIISPVADRASLLRMGVDTENVVNVGDFSSGQRSCLGFHRSNVLLQAAR